MQLRKLYKVPLPNKQRVFLTAKVGKFAILFPLLYSIFCHITCSPAPARIQILPELLYILPKREVREYPFLQIASCISRNSELNAPGWVSRCSVLMPMLPIDSLLVCSGSIPRSPLLLSLLCFLLSVSASSLLSIKIISPHYDSLPNHVPSCFHNS